MPLKNSVVDVEEDKITRLALRRSTRLNANPSTLSTSCASGTSKVVSERKGNKNFYPAEEVDEVKSSIINEVTTNLATGITEDQNQAFTSVPISPSNDGTKLITKQNSDRGIDEISDGFHTKRITRSQTDSKAKIITKECFVVLEEARDLQVTAIESKVNLKEVGISNLDEAREVVLEKQIDAQDSSKEDFDVLSFSENPHEKEQILADKITEEFLPNSCNLNLIIKPAMGVLDCKDATTFKTEDTFMDNSVRMKNNEEKKNSATTDNQNCVFENDKEKHEVTVNQSEEINSHINGKLETYADNVTGTTEISKICEDRSSVESSTLHIGKEMLSEFRENPNFTDSTNQIINIADQREYRHLTKLADDGNNDRKIVRENEVLNKGDSLLDSSLEKTTIYSASIEENDIDSKIDDLLLSKRSSTSDSEENEHNPFIDSMAEECEEDTPSDGSNSIVEVGEEINTTESEFSTDESYENNSFIDDENEYQLLSGEEYDLSFDKTNKKSRIIQLSSGSDDDIVRISKRKKESQKIRRKSRIIKFVDSSDEEASSCNANVNVENSEKEPCNSGFKEIPNLCNDWASQIIQSENQNEIEKNVGISNILNNKDNEENTIQLRDLNNLEESTAAVCNVTSTKSDMNQVSVNESNKRSKIVDVKYRKNEETFAKTEPIELSTSSTTVNVSVIKNTENNRSVVRGNIKVENIYGKGLSDRINEVIDALCFDLKNVNEVTINLSVDYSDRTSEIKNEVDESIVMKLTEDAIHKTNIFKDGSKKQRIKKRNIRKKKIFLEDEVAEPASKKMKRDEENKKNKVTFINENNSTPNYTPAHVLIKNQKLSYNHKEKMSVLLAKIDKQLQEPNISEMKYIQEKRSNVLLEKGNKQLFQDTKEPLSENIHVKRKKRLKENEKTVSNSATAMNIMDEAFFDIKNKKTPSVSQDVQIYEKWDVKNILVKSSTLGGVQKNKVEHKIKRNKSENVDIPNKFREKDFKNLMLYDSSRIKRIDTKQIIKKRGVIV